MPARKRHKPGGVEDVPDLSTRSGRKVAQKSAAQIFAERQQAVRDEQREASRVRREAQQREDRRRELTKAKDAAASRLKEVRRRGASGAARTDAEAAYRAALDALIRDEQGLPPLSEEEQAAAVAAPRELEAAEEAAVADSEATDAEAAEPT
ncbi:MAG TPA: hypothetical protein VK507_21210 [Iamia sp.]|nr:hypothetical protein [Iamia sp.]